MSYGICNLSIIPCRAEASDKSEMVTQLLFGEHFKILEEKDSWCRIQNAFDEYESWIDIKQFVRINQQSFKQLNEAPKTFTAELIQVIEDKNQSSFFPVVFGSLLPSFSHNICSLGEQKYRYEGQTIKAPNKVKREQILDFAYMYLNSPYLWGGRSPLGIDCSGFTQMAYKLNGIDLLRDAYQQAKQGTTLSFMEEATAGDLAFFDNKEGKITHVGIILPENKIIHASGKVRIDKLDHYGIYNEAEKKYTHNLRVLKRVID